MQGPAIHRRTEPTIQYNEFLYQDPTGTGCFAGERGSDAERALLDTGTIRHGQGIQSGPIGATMLRPVPHAGNR